MTKQDFHNLLINNGFAYDSKSCDGLVTTTTNKQGIHVADFLTEKGFSKEEYSDNDFRGFERNWITYRKNDVCTVTIRKEGDIANQKTGRKVEVKSFSLADPVDFIGRKK